ncbi:hypothetical protein E3N88_44041 [Mikania micrantha]|uniref:Ubiquitin-like protease family profile domain-containing protein n=1 Tax=Mikania micrantha TaxID=192012 RepID=A0A5N6LD60_9ASTR|nr:hypothetical protein E3N88_44041 [Mikania micrantha]
MANITADFTCILCMDLEQENNCSKIKRKKPSPDDCQQLNPTVSCDDDRRPELEATSNKKSDDADKGCDETIQVSDHSDDGKINCSDLFKVDKDSRTVYAFEEDLSCSSPCHGRKLMSKSQLLGKGRLSSSRNLKTSLVGGKKPRNSNDQNKDGDSTASVSEPISPQDPPSRNLRPRSARAYHLVDEETVIEKFMQNLDPCLKDVKVYYPSRDDPDAVEVNYDYMACLAPEAYISSIIMNFYIRYLQQPSSPSKSATCHYHFFNTYFYNKLEKLSYKEDSFLKFRKWWKGVNLFEKAYILLPVHENVHWSLVIICFPNKEDELGPILLHLDSLGLHDSKLLFDNITRRVQESQREGINLICQELGMLEVLCFPACGPYLVGKDLTCFSPALLQTSQEAGGVPVSGLTRHSCLVMR